MPQFTVTGNADLGKYEQPFEQVVDAESEDHAREQIKSRFGSKHGISRSNVRIESLEQE